MASAHLDALSSRHATIDSKIALEMNRPLPDSAQLARLKREKLKVKEQIARQG